MKNQPFCRQFLCLLTVSLLFALCVAIPSGASSADKAGESSPEVVESAKAAAIQLMKTEGDVDVSNSGGRTVSIIKNMKLYNGYRTNTQEASYAWINLDSEKLTKLDAVSETEIRKSGKKLEILLKSGSLFFDVREPLEDEETLNIRTSTMVTGIRGTCGWVKVIDRWHSRVYILEGTVVCYVTDPVTGQIKSTTLSAGEMAEFVVYEEDRDGERCDILRRGFAEGEIDGFVLAELAGDGGLRRRTGSASGLDIEGAAANAAEYLAADQLRMKEAMEAIREAYARQENHISKDPVWVHGGRDWIRSEDESQGTPSGGMTSGRGTVLPGTGTPGTSSGGGVSSDTGNGSGSEGGGSAPADSQAPSGGSSSSGTGGGGSNPPANPEGTENPGGTVTPNPPVTLTDDGAGNISPESIQALLDDPDVTEVVVKPNPDGTGSSVNVRTPGPDLPPQTLVIPDGKTLTLDNVDLVNDGDITVDGTLNLNGNLDNRGTITVNGSLPDYTP